jgi:hypothetical protein
MHFHTRQKVPHRIIKPRMWHSSSTSKLAKTDLSDNWEIKRGTTNDKLKHTREDYDWYLKTYHAAQLTKNSNRERDTKNSTEWSLTKVFKNPCKFSLPRWSSLTSRRQKKSFLSDVKRRVRYVTKKRVNSNGPFLTHRSEQLHTNYVLCNSFKFVRFLRLRDTHGGGGIGGSGGTVFRKRGEKSTSGIEELLWKVR